ncbi:MAG: amidohydrolase family protein [Candidatus Aminicenantes bacterium]|nr:amidohydrolase family protein [Candidatus Aminicenantes bacterium]
MKTSIVIAALAALTALWTPAAETTGPVLIRGARIVPVEGPVLESGDLLIENGKITAVGPSVKAPEGARVIEASGLTAYPGFIDAYTQYGLVEIGAIAATVDSSEMGKENPEVRAAWAINPHSVHFRTGRICGTTAALVAPAGGTFPGISALVKMEGWSFPEMAVKEEATSLINFPMSPRPPTAEQVGPKPTTEIDVTSKLVEKIKEYLSEARHYLALKKEAASNPAVKAPDHNPKYEALAPVFEGTLPVILSVEKAKDIELALKFIKEEKIKAVFRGCAQGYKVADKIKAAGIPVIVGDLYRDPSEPEDGYDAPFRNVAELSKAGVTLCFSSGTNPSTGKDLPYHAARAVAFGMSHEDAVKALTINPARVFGIDDRLGTLAPGKDADLFLTTGDPLDLRSEVKHMFISGREIDLGNWWKDLYDKWKSRPLK